MRMRRLLAVLLLLSMLVSVVPTSVFAVETENGSDGETAATAVDPSVAPSDNLFVDKTVTLTEDGTYSINMEAYATGTLITKTLELGVPLDVVLVVDQSGSLKNSGSVDSMKNSIRDFMNALKANGEAVGVDHRVSICSFAGDDLAGLSGPADETYGYSFAGDLWDLAWLNTGLYVDGKFQDYGTVEYTRIDSLDKLDTTRYYLVKYTRTLENGSSVAEYFRIYYYKDYGSWYIHNGKEGLVSLATREKDGESKTTSEDLIANYEVYDIGESTLQLDQADYAASWEYIADGQGNLNADVAAAINSLASNGGTRTSYGLKMARNMLKYITPGTDNDIRKKVVVVFTDGKAGAGWNNDGEMAATLAEANKIKASGVDIYTVGVYSNAAATDIASFMNQFSSNCGLIGFSENPTTEYEYNNLDQNTWVNSVTGRYRTLPSFYKVENKDGTVEFCPVRVHVETRYSDAAGNWVVTPPYKWTYITDTGEMPIPTELLNEDGTAIKGLYKIGSGDYNSEAGYYQTSNSFDNLSSLFQKILDKETIFYSEVELDTTAILKDVLADGFTLTDNTQITVSVVPGSVSEENSNLSPNELTSDKITWSEEAQQVLTMNARAQTAASEPFVVTGAFDQTEMTLTATAKNGEINVTGYNYAAQFIGKDHVGSKLVVTVTGVEAVTGVTTNAATSTNKATSGVYEGLESDADKDGIPGEIETPFPIPTTYLTSEYYYLNKDNTVTIDPKDFLMDNCVNADADGYNFFNVNTPGTTVKTQYGTVTVNGDGTVTYQLKEGVELEKDIICLFGKTEDPTVKAASANANGNMWSKITILPPLDAVGKLHTDKSATLMGDGTYTIDLEAFATGTPALATLSTKQPLDVVLVVDQSGSLCEFYTTENAEGKKVYEWNRDALEALKASVSSFVHELQANADANGLNHRISICGFGSDEFIGWSVGREYLHDKEANLAKEQGTELPEPSKGVENCYTYAGDLEGICFTNTGLFVNGEFKKYGTIKSERVIVNTIDDVVDNEVYIANEKGTDRYIPVTYYPNHGAWRVWASDGWWTFFDKVTKEENVCEFLEKYDLYTLPREITVQLTDKDYQNSWETVSVNGNLNPDIAKTIDSLAGNGATFISYGMRMARHMLENAPDPNDEEGVERKKVVIVFTDGRPGGTDIKNAGEAEAALAEAQQIKNGLVDKNGKAIKAEIYTVGIYNGETKGDDEFMNLLSSNCASHTFSELNPQLLDNKDYDRIVTNDYLFIPKYFYKLEKGNGDVEYCPIKVYWKSSETGYEWYYITDEGLNRIPSGTVNHRTITGAYKLESGEYNPVLGYYSNSDNFSDLPGLFREIVTEVSTYSSEVQLDAKAILKDVMADGFTLTNNTQITVSVVPGSVKEEYADVGANRLGSEHIAWGTPQKVLTFKYSEAKEGTGKVVVNGAADQTEMTLSAQVTEDGIITVTGFNYAAALDNHKENAQYICAGHPGSKLVVTITGVEAKNGVTTDSFTVTNKGASGIYEASDSDMDGDGTFGEMQAYFPIPTTYLSSKTYYLDYSGKITIDTDDFLMTINGVFANRYGYHGYGGTEIETEHGKVTINSDGTITYEMNPGAWEKTDTFYLFGYTDNATVKAAMANTTGNMWSKITIITPEDITGKLFLNKEATLTDDGTYTIDLNAYATGMPSITSITEGVPLDASSILKDVMADGFTLTDNTTITVSVVPGSVKEEYANLTPDELTSDKITWGEPQQVLTFQYSTAEGAENTGSGDVIVNDAADKTKMTLTAKVTEDGIITVDGFNYAGPKDSFYVDAQYIRTGHAGSKLMVTITGVEAKTDVVTDSVTTTNKGASGIYESEDSDLDEDGETGELQASFPIPTTYLTSEFYYLDKNNSVTINPKDFLMTIKGINADPDGYNFFDVNNPGTTVETEHGTVTVNEDGTVTYQLTNTDWENEDIFYLFGKTEDPTVTDADANKDGNMWSKITILPPKDASGKLHLDKEATLESNGTYTIDLEAFATGTPASTIIKDGIPLDVVLVIDQSGSLFTGDGGGSLETLKNSVTSFIETLKTNGEAFGVNHRVSICGFASSAKQGASGVKHYGLSYANNIQDNAWINTGLFVNGQFKDYGTLEYIPVESVDDIVSSRYYAVEHDFDEDGIMEISRAYVKNGAWVVSSGTPSGTQYITLAGVTKDADGNVTATANENLFNNYKVYTVGDSSNLLTDADYAASWENIADGLNGQGNINPDITKTIDSLAASGATATFYGLKMAARMLANVPDDGIERKRVVIVFTDGVPGFNGYTQGDGDAALSEVMKIKETDAEVYAVGIYKASSATSVETFMNQLSSNYVSHSFATEPVRMDMSKASTSSTFLKYSLSIDGSYYGISPYFRKVVNDDGTEDFWPIAISYDPNDTSVYYASYITDDVEIPIGSGAKDAIPGLVGDVYMLAEPVVNDHPDADYYKYSTNIDDLTAMFKTITTDATTFASETALGVDAVLKDVMASNFVLTDNTTVTVSVVPGSISKENEDLTADQLTSDKITWGEAQQVLTFNYPEVKEGTGKVIVNGAADQTEMTLKAEVKDGVITVTGFNYASPADNHKENAQYICAGHPGSKLVVTITGVEAQSNVVTDSVTVTNKGTSGIYEGPNSDMDGDGVKGEIQSSFPVPTTYMASKVYVVDYAKTMTINPSDFKMTVGAVSVDVDGYNRFDPAVTAVTGTYGKVAVEGGKITYTPTRTNWNGYDTFYIFGTTNNATIKAATANENGNMWAKVSVVPANNVYYEDTFVSNEDTGVVGIVFGGVWEEVKETVNAGSNGENAESGESTTKDDQGNDHQGGVHGWEDNLADDTGFSDGGAHVAGKDGKTGATATFTFTGTGVDIYSRTNDETGMVIAMLYEGTSTTGEDNKNLVAKYSLVVDNLAASGDYYQIPTLSFFQIPLKIDGKIQKDENGNTIMTDLPYGTYTVKITVSKANASQTGEARTLYYLDGIRVYNPIQNQEGDSTVSGAYGEKELNANFVEIRDKLLDANSFSAEDAESAGPVFIDRITSEDGSHTDNTKTVEIGTYKVFGPKNEVYLSANQIVAFAVPYTEGAHYYIGMKSLTGKTVKVIPNSTDDYVNLIVVGHTTDQYYEVIPEWEYDEHGNPTTGIIFVHADITNGDYKKDKDGNYITDENGNYITEVDGAGAILALTKLKVTGPKAKNFKFARVSNDKLLEMIAEDLAPSLDMDDTNSSPDVGGNTPNKPNVDINKPSSDTTVDEQTALKNLMIDLLTRIFGDLRGWFKS